MNEADHRTLHTKPGYQGRKQHHFKGPKQFKPKGHDAILKDFQDRKVLVAVYLTSSEEAINGTITARDKFTISVLHADGKGFGPDVIYKHAIDLIRPLSLGEQKEAVTQ